MRSMIIAVTSPLAVRRSVPGGRRSPGRNGLPTRTVTRPPGCGSVWPLGQTRFEPEIPSGTIGAPVRMARTAIPSRASWRTPSGLRRGPADERPGEELLLAEPMDAPAEPRYQPRTDHDRVEVRGVVGGEDHRSLARDLVDRTLDGDPAQRSPENPATERQCRDQRGDRALDRGGVAHAMAPLMRWCRSVPVQRHGAPRHLGSR